MKCLECNTLNPSELNECRKCGAPLAPARAAHHLEQARAAILRGRYDAATMHLNQADVAMLKVSKAERDRLLLTARAFAVQGYIYYGSGQMNEAKQELLLAVESLEQQTTGRDLLANTLGRLGNVSYYLTEMDEALNYYERSAAVATASGAYTVAARTLTNVGSIYIERGDLENGKASYDSALALAITSGDADTQAQVYRLLAWFHANYGPFTQALAYTDTMLELGARAASVEAAAFIAGEATNIYTWYGDLERARQLASQAHNLAQQSGSEVAREHVAMSLTELLRQDSNQDDWFAKALKVLDGAARNGAMIKRELSLHLAIYYVSLKDEARMRRYLQILRERQDIKDVRTATLNQYAQGLLYAALGEWRAADNYFKLILSDSRLTTYELAVAWREYGAMLLRRAKAERNAAWRAEAKVAFAASIALFRQLQMPLRVKQVEAALAKVKGGNTSAPATDPPADSLYQ